MRTRGQERAKFALDKVINIQGEKKKDKFAKFSSGAPSMILQNGFGQALAFWLSKKEDHHLTMFDIVKEWLCLNNLAQGQTKTDFISTISQMDQTKYLTAQKETLALLEWVKRYANAGL